MLSFSKWMTPAVGAMLVASGLVGCVQESYAPPIRHRRVAGTYSVEPTAGAEAPASASLSPAFNGQPASISRTILLPALDAGIGRFLGTVLVEAVLERGRFVGFRIRGFRDADHHYANVDLAPGDVVLRVNGSPIERPEQALAVWNGLRVTSELCVEYLRDGTRREIRIAIVD